MQFKVDVVLRGTEAAQSETITAVAREPRDWTDSDVRQVLEGMLSTMHRMKHPEELSPAVTLRGLSWIVSPFEEGGVVIALEVGMGAAVAGPFDADPVSLEKAIARVISGAQPAPPTTVH